MQLRLPIYSVKVYDCLHSVEALCNDNRCLLVGLSVCPMPRPKSKMEGRRSLKLVGGEPITRLTRDPHLEVKGQGHQAA